MSQQSRLATLTGQIENARSLNPVAGARQMAHLLEEILPDTVRDGRDQAVCGESSRLLAQMKLVRENEGDLALDPEGDLASLLAQYTYGDPERGRIIEDHALEYLLVSARVRLCSPDQLRRFAEQVLLQSLQVEVALGEAVESVRARHDGQLSEHSGVRREGARLSLIANWRSPIDETKTVDEQWASLQRRVWAVIVQRRYLESFEELKSNR